MHRHLDKAREAFELAAVMDPRFKHMPWTRSSEERDRIREKVVEAALSTLPGDGADAAGDAPVQVRQDVPRRPASWLDERSLRSKNYRANRHHVCHVRDSRAAYLLGWIMDQHLTDPPTD